MSEDGSSREYLDRMPGYVNQISNSIDALTEALAEDSKSSSRLAKALNFLTAALVLLGALTLALELIKYLTNGS